MKLILQRVKRAQVSVKPDYSASIDRGLLILTGFHQDDAHPDLPKLVKKILKMRLFPDNHKPINASLIDVKGEILLIPQFTLYAQTDKGNRPFFGQALKPDLAQKLFDKLVNEFKAQYHPEMVKTGKFGQYMEIDAVLSGPVTIILNHTAPGAEQRTAPRAV